MIQITNNIPITRPVFSFPTIGNIAQIPNNSIKKLPKVNILPIKPVYIMFLIFSCILIVE